MSHRNVLTTALVACVLLYAPISMANDQNHDMADRIYEKFKERDQSQQREQRTRSSQTQRAQRERNDSRASDASERRTRSTAKTREVSRESREYERAEERSRSRDVGEQVSRELRNLLDRKSQRSSTRESSRTNTRQNTVQNSYIDERTVRPSADGGDRVSLDQAVNIVRRQSDGKVISARTEGSGSSRKHRIKVLIGERRVRTYVVSAATGRVY